MNFTGNKHWREIPRKDVLDVPDGTPILFLGQSAAQHRVYIIDREAPDSATLGGNDATSITPKQALNWSDKIWVWGQT